MITSTLILPVVAVDETGKPIHCRVRRIKVDAETNKVVCKYALSKSGEWVLIPEGAKYPEETILAVSDSLRYIPCSNGCGEIIYTSFDESDSGNAYLTMCSSCFDKTETERWAEEQ